MALSQLPVTNTYPSLKLFSSVNRHFILNPANKFSTEPFQPQTDIALSIISSEGSIKWVFFWISAKLKLVISTIPFDCKLVFHLFWYQIKFWVKMNQPVYSDRRCTGCQMPLRTRTGYRSNCMTHTAFCLCCLFL